MSGPDTNFHQTAGDRVSFIVQFTKRQMSPRNSARFIARFRKHNRALVRHSLCRNTKAICNIKRARH